jgi:hypothetical protein
MIIQSLNPRIRAQQGLDEMARYENQKHLFPGDDALADIAQCGTDQTSYEVASTIRPLTMARQLSGGDAANQRWAEITYQARRNTLQLIANGINGSSGAAIYQIGVPLLARVDKECPEMAPVALQALSARAYGISPLIELGDGDAPGDYALIHDVVRRRAFDAMGRGDQYSPELMPTVALAASRKLQAEHPHEAAFIGAKAVDYLWKHKKYYKKENAEAVRLLEAARPARPGRIRRLFGARSEKLEDKIADQQKALLAFGARDLPTS